MVGETDEAYGIKIAKNKKQKKETQNTFQKNN